MKSGWDAYAEALRLLVRAPDAARSKRDDAAAVSQRRLAGADAQLREAVNRREAVESRLGELERLIRETMDLGRVPNEGPAESIRAPAITEVGQVAAAADEFERLVAAAVAGLEESRLPPPPKSGRLWWYAAAGLIAVVLIVVVAILTTV